MKGAVGFAVSCYLMFAAFTALAEEEPLEQYVAMLSVQDHYNSRGRQLKSAAGIIRQDRANYHKFKKSDADDHDDSFFSKRSNRDMLEKLLTKGRMDKATRRAILDGTPLVRVSIYRDRVDVALIEEEEPSATGKAGVWDVDEPRNKGLRIALSDGCAIGTQDDVLVKTTYVARLSADDHFNSKGRRLKSAGAVIQQDRANFHKFDTRDPDDASDTMFSEFKQRSFLTGTADGCLTDKAVVKTILNGSPLVRITAAAVRVKGDKVQRRVFVEVIAE